MHWNMAGGTIHRGNVAIADRLADSVASRRPGLPLAVSVNEVCFHQWERLFNRLTALGYTGHFGVSLWHTNPSNAEPKCVFRGMPSTDSGPR